MKAKTSNTVTRTADLMRRLVTVPKAELEAQERLWKKRRAKTRRKAKS